MCAWDLVLITCLFFPCADSKGDKGETGGWGDNGLNETICFFSFSFCSLIPKRGCMLTLALSLLTGAVGAKGDDGYDGHDGRDGRDGAQGSEGDKGQKGSHGRLGDAGVDGIDGSLVL